MLYYSVLSVKTGSTAGFKPKAEQSTDIPKYI